MNTKTPLLSQSQRSYLIQLSFESWFLWCSLYGVVKHVCLRANIEEKFCFAFFSIFFTCFIFSRTILFSRNNSINLRKLDISLLCSLYIHRVIYNNNTTQYTSTQPLQKYTTSTQQVHFSLVFSIHTQGDIQQQHITVNKKYTTSTQQVHNHYTTSTFLSRVLYTYTGDIQHITVHNKYTTSTQQVHNKYVKKR